MQAFCLFILILVIAHIHSTILIRWHYLDNLGDYQRIAFLDTETQNEIGIESAAYINGIILITPAICIEHPVTFAL